MYVINAENSISRTNERREDGKEQDTDRKKNCVSIRHTICKFYAFFQFGCGFFLLQKSSRTWIFILYTLCYMLKCLFDLIFLLLRAFAFFCFFFYLNSISFPFGLFYSHSFFLSIVSSYSFAVYNETTHIIHFKAILIELALCA